MPADHAAPPAGPAASTPPVRGLLDTNLMIASTAIASDLPLFTTNPDDFAGLAGLLTVIAVRRPPVPRER